MKSCSSSTFGGCKCDVREALRVVIIEEKLDSFARRNLNCVFRIMLAYIGCGHHRFLGKLGFNYALSICTISSRLPCHADVSHGSCGQV